MATQVMWVLGIGTLIFMLTRQLCVLAGELSPSPVSLLENDNH